MKLSIKLIGGFGIVLILLMTVMGVYQYMATATTTGFENLMRENIALSNHAARSAAFMLQSRRNEKDFLIRLEKKYEGRLAESVEGLKSEARGVIGLANKMGDQASVSKASSIIQLADEYEMAFKELVSSWETKGLDHKSGLQGALRNIVQGVAEDMKEHQVDNLRIAYLQMRRYEKDYVRTGSDRYRRHFQSSIENYGRLLSESECEEAAKRVQEDALSAYSRAFVDYLRAGKSAKLKTQSYQMVRTAAHEMENAINEVLVPGAGALLLDIRKNEKDYLLRNDEKYVKKTHDAIEKLTDAFRNAGVLKIHTDDADTNLKAYKEAFDRLVEENGRISELTAAMVSAAHKVEPAVEELYLTAQKGARGKVISTTEMAARLANVAIAVGVLAIAIGIFLALSISRSITRPINRIVDGLNNGADRVASASGQVSSSSQQLADGSSEQAASIEETSSSLEEISSMTKQNADNATQADSLMKEAKRVVQKANTSMHELTGSMEEISKASEETSKIIKTIDEIAFQTNLLALNAAVEAARAGESGAGFAVVADEVRNLSLRAADAARSSADLIDGTVKRVKEGSDVVKTTNEAFGEVAENASKVSELVGEIAAASKQQAQGIEQVNIAVTEMDKVTRSNTANAEESASASEEMNGQAEQMKALVGELMALVGGSSNGALNDPPGVADGATHRAYAPPVGRGRSKALIAHQITGG